MMHTIWISFSFPSTVQSYSVLNFEDEQGSRLISGGVARAVYLLISSSMTSLGPAHLLLFIWFFQLVFISRSVG